jgi:DNA-binding transcriptional LysR family regulator
MDVAALKLFVEVMQQRSFTEVAQIHRIAPSSVSRTIANLERELGIRLFQRSTRHLKPTEAGLVYFERITPIVEAVDAARDMAADVTEEPRGTLRVTAPVVFGQTHIVPLLPQLAQRYPLLSIELLLTDAYVDLIEDRIDVAVRLGSLRDTSYVAKRLRKMEFFICASPDYVQRRGTPHAPNEIKLHDCLLFPRMGHNLSWKFRDARGRVVEAPISGNCLITNSEAIRQCALAGMGLALLPDWLVQGDIERGALVRLFEGFAVTATNYDSAVWLLYPSREYLPLKTRAFVDHVVEGIGDG